MIIKYRGKNKRDYKRNKNVKKDDQANGIQSEVCVSLSRFEPLCQRPTPFPASHGRRCRSAQDQALLEKKKKELKSLGNVLPFYINMFYETSLRFIIELFIYWMHVCLGMSLILSNKKIILILFETSVNICFFFSFQ